MGVIHIPDSGSLKENSFCIRQLKPLNRDQLEVQAAADDPVS